MGGTGSAGDAGATAKLQLTLHLDHSAALINVASLNRFERRGVDDGLPERRHIRIVNADAFQSLVRIPNIIEIRAPDSCGLGNHPRFVDIKSSIRLRPS